ncbi:TPA: serine acetyltransferase [Vibrio vulnificus]|nr:serine acetyltransferase [Vibrio vulnificus]
MSIRYIISDIKQASMSDSFSSWIKTIIVSPSAHLLILFRVGQSVSQIPVIGRLFGVVLEYAIRLLYASDISLKARVEPGLVIVHGHDIVIGADVKIGKNCKIFNGVTLGNKDVFTSSKGNQPTIYDDVVICTGAKILGPVSVGSASLVGANSVLLVDCPANSVAVGVPAKIIDRNHD